MQAFFLFLIALLQDDRKMVVAFVILHDEVIAEDGTKKKILDSITDHTWSGSTLTPHDILRIFTFAPSFLRFFFMFSFPHFRSLIFIQI